MTKPKTDHIHRIKKIGPIWRCLINDGSDCPYFVYFAQQLVLIGRTFLCWSCGIQFKFTEANLTEDLPFCDSCRNPVFDDFADIAAEIEKKKLTTYEG